MNVTLEGIVIIVGNYGSGKTEVAINLAINRKRAGIDVRIADLDLVNPYFRTREARKLFSETDIDLVLPPEEYLNADLPIVSPAVAGMIQHPTQLTIIDCGGDDVGATVLASLADVFRQKRMRVLQVVNRFRPFTETKEGCLKIRDEIESVSHLRVTGFIGNTNLMDETTAEHICDGYDFMKTLSEDSGLPVAFITADTELMTEIDIDRFECPVLPIKRRLTFPWKK